MTNETVSLINQTRSSSPDEPEPFWETWVVLPLVDYSAALFNSALCLFLLMDRSLRSSFKTYLMFLTGLNALYTTLNRTIDLIGQYIKWGLKSFPCVFSQFSQFGLGGMVLQSHCLITINRLWAVTFPLSYRNYHSDRVALIFGLFMFVYENCFLIPGQVINWQVVNHTNIGCGVNIPDSRAWHRTYTIGSRLVPTAIVLAGWFYLFWHHRKWNKGVSERVETRQNPEIPKSRRKSMYARRRASAKIALGAAATTSVVKIATRRAHRSSAFKIVTLSTLSVVISCVPMDVELAGASWRYFRMELTIAANVANTLQPFLDPLLIILGFEELRNALWSKLKNLTKR